MFASMNMSSFFIILFIIFLLGCPFPKIDLSSHHNLLFKSNTKSSYTRYFTSKVFRSKKNDERRSKSSKVSEHNSSPRLKKLQTLVLSIVTHTKQNSVSIFYGFFFNRYYKECIRRPIYGTLKTYLANWTFCNHLN